MPTEGGGGVGIFGEGVSGLQGTSQSGTNAAAVFNSRGFSGSGGTSEDPTTTSREKGYGGGGTGNEDDGDNGAANGAGQGTSWACSGGIQVRTLCYFAVVIRLGLLGGHRLCSVYAMEMRAGKHRQAQGYQ